METAGSAWQEEGEVGVEGLERRRDGGDGGDGGGGGGGGDGSQSPPRQPGLSLPAWKVGIGDLSQVGNVCHNMDQDQLPAPGPPLSRCIDMRSGWDRAPDN